MTSSVDPSVAKAAIINRLNALIVEEGGVFSGRTYEGVPQGTKLDLDGFGNKTPYRDFEAGGTTPTTNQRLLAAGEQGQPHYWAFQVHHYASTRAAADSLATETDMSLIGWEPSDDASKIKQFYFQSYDETDKAGDRIGWINTRFYETELGQIPDMSLM